MELEISLRDAEQKATEVVAKLQPYCERIDIAGSIRRKKSLVGDIEICCLPSVVAEQDIFGTIISVKRSPAFSQEVNKLGRVIKGSTTGRYVQIMLDDDVQLDLFMPENHDYIRQLIIRTGSVEFSKRIAKAWYDMGWCGTADGLRLKRECVHDGHKWNCTVSNPTLPPVWGTEQEFFDWLQFKYVEPQHRF